MVQGIIQAYTTDGHKLQTWTTAHTVAGITYDPGTQTVYFTTGDAPYIYAISVNSSGAPRYVAEVGGASKLGAIAIDSAHQQLYIADVDHGTVFAMDIASHHGSQAGQVGTPQAFLFDANGPFLLVADSAGKQIVALDLRGGKRPPRVLNTAKTLRSPSGPTSRLDPLRWWIQPRACCTQRACNERTALSAACAAREDQFSSLKICSMGRPKSRASLKASGRLGSNLPVSTAFTDWRETSSRWASSACDQLRSARSTLRRFFIDTSS